MRSVIKEGAALDKIIRGWTDKHCVTALEWEKMKCETCLLIFKTPILDFCKEMHPHKDFIIIICIGNSMVSRGIWDKYHKWYFKIHQNITSCRASDIWGFLKYHEPPVFIANTPKKPCYFLFILQGKEISHFDFGFFDWLYNMWLAVIFTCKYFKFGLNTTGLSQ